VPPAGQRGSPAVINRQAKSFWASAEVVDTSKNSTWASLSDSETVTTEEFAQLVGGAKRCGLWRSAQLEQCQNASVSVPHAMLC
jgi:hypothetical protein